MSKKIVVVCILLSIITSCKSKKGQYVWKSMKVTVSAYNSVSWQTSGNPSIAAWGDTLIPGMKCIAVSRDLLRKGLARDTKVKIEGLDGIYLVKDKMHGRWTNRIDLYMGKDVEKARQWGLQKRTIQYAVLKDSLEL